MKKIGGIIFIILAISIVMQALQNNPKVILAKLKAPQFYASQKQLSYRIYLLGIIPVGRAILVDKGPQKIGRSNFYLLSANAESAGIVSRIYPFSVIIESYLDASTLLPVSFRQALKTREKNTIKEVSYDQKNMVMQVKEVKRTILPETYEPLSALYRLRSLALGTLASFDLNINTNQKNYALEGTVTKEIVKINGQEVGIFKLSGKIFRRDKNPYHQSSVNIVLIDNSGKTPAYMKIFASGILITVRLVGAQ